MNKKQFSNTVGSHECVEVDSLNEEVIAKVFRKQPVRRLNNI